MFRAAEIYDLPQILEINNELEIDRWSEEKFREIFEHEIPTLVAINENSKIIGFIVYLICLDEVRILNLVVANEFQNYGYGRTLIFKALEDAVAKFEVKYGLLEVDVSNLKALNLYSSIGYRILCVRKNYYFDKYLRDAYLMQIELCTSLANDRVVA